jgi:hypothetical protein
MTNHNQRLDEILEHIVLATDNGQPYIKSTDTAVEAIKALIATQVNQARIEAQKEILAFATRVQANGQYIPIEVGLIPWLEAQLSNTHKEQL